MTCAAAADQIQFDYVAELARRAVRNWDVIHRCPTVVEENGFLLFDLGDVTVYRTDDRLADWSTSILLETQMQIELIRMHYKGEKGDLHPDFWEPVLREAEKIVQEQIRFRATFHGPQSEMVERLRQCQEQVRVVMTEPLLEHAKRRGLGVPRTVRETSENLATVRFNTEPEGGEVYILALLDWWAIQLAGADPEKRMRKVGINEPIQMCGTFVVMHVRDGKKLRRPYPHAFKTDGIYTCKGANIERTAAPGLVPRLQGAIGIK